MTKNEAVERAFKIWGTQVREIRHVTWRHNAPGPGDAEWEVKLENGNWHDFDCNGHPTCHQACDEASVQVC